jgi:hypothetical protein
MSYNISSIPLFDKQAKRLAKKHPSLKNDLAKLIERLTVNPEEGTALGNNFFKIRLAIGSKDKGKSGGARVITFVKINHNSVILTSILDKSERSSLSKMELDEIFKLIP